MNAHPLYSGVTMTLCGAALCAAVVMLCAPRAEAVQEGRLQVYGHLTDGVCQVELASRWQTVSLGETTSWRLDKPGDQGERIPFQLRLRDCLRNAGSARDRNSGNLVWASQQPVVSVTFTAQTDADNPELVALRGTAGVGLRISDDQWRTVRMGQPQRPDFLSPDADTLTWYATPERTAGALRPGAFLARMNFTLNYE